MRLIFVRTLSTTDLPGILYELYLGRFDDALKAYQTYQTLTDTPDLRVAGWVSDLQRRLAGNES